MELENEADVPVAECRQFFFRKADGFGPVIYSLPLSGASSVPMI